MARRRPRRYRLAIPSRRNNKRRPTSSSRIRDSSLPKRRQSLRRLSTRQTHPYNTQPSTHYLSIPNILRWQDSIHRYGDLCLHETVHGTAWLRITDSNLFVNEVVGGQGAFSTPQVDDFIRGFINERVIDEMSKYDLQTAFTQLDKASVTVKVNINDALKRIGTDLVDFKFEGIDTSDQFRDRLFWIKQKAATSDVLRMETAKDIGASLSTSSGAGLGSGMVLIPQVMNAQMQPSVQPQAALVACPKCGNGVQQGARFCPNCGATMFVAPPPAQAMTPCPNCGKPVASGTKFCPECGQKMR